jgi:rare lipoprotein A
MISTPVAATSGVAQRRVLLAAGLLSLASAPALAASGKVQGEGIASFYGREHHGGPTASGERFNMNAMTAAHRTAPLGSHLRVTNLKNGKSVVVRINDRGPFVRGRVIDLSRGAADVLGFTGAGLTRVAIETTDAGTPAGAIRVASADQIGRASCRERVS